MKEDNTTIDPTWMERTGGYARDKTLREWYAGMAMQGLLRDDDSTVLWNRVPEYAFEMADAMLKAREAK